MRVTNVFMAKSITDQLSQVSDRLGRLQLDITSGVRIHKPSDDPGGALRATHLRTGLAYIDSYQSTAREVNMWLKGEEVALGQMQELLRTVRDQGLQGANPNSPDVREPIAAQIDALRNSLLQLGNTAVGTRYIFAGFQTSASPFAEAGGVVTYAGDQGAISAAIGDGVSLLMNNNGASVFNMGGVSDATVPDIFATISDLAADVRAGDQDGVRANIAELDKHMARLNTVRAETGRRLQQVSLANDQLAQSALMMNDLLGETESTDLSQALVDLKTQENLFQAASYIASTLGKGGLLDWLR
ncbi:MAG: flagellar hook-associated protein FlgL [Armatimonadota bacterium]